MTRLRLLFFSTLLLLPALIAVTPTAAAVPTTPSTLVAEVLSTKACDGCSPEVQANISIVFKLSAEDPDQVDGDWTYYVTYDDGPPIDETALFTAISGRTGWKRQNISAIGGGSYGNEATNILTIWMNASDGTERSVASCSVTIDLRVAGSFDQCGSELAAPTGLNGAVTQAITPTTGRTVLRWLLSADDPNATVGAFQYRIYLSTHPVNGVALEDFFLDTDPVGANDTAGKRYYDDDYRGEEGATLRATYKVLARDPLTLRRSDYSCPIHITNGLLYDQSFCGEIGGPGIGPGSDGPQFPLLDVPQAAEDIGVSTEAFGLALGGMLIVGGVFAGGAAAKLSGSVAGGILGVGLSATLGLIPMWALIALFALGVTVVVLYLRGGGNQ